MESQQHSLDLSTLAHALPASPSPAEQDKVVASLSTLPPELKLKIVEEIWEAPEMLHEVLRRLSRWRETRIRGLSLVNKQFYELTAIFLWRKVDLCHRSLFSIHFFLFNIYPKHRLHIRAAYINRQPQQRPLCAQSNAGTSSKQVPLFSRHREMTGAERSFIFDQAEELEKRMTGSTTRYEASNCTDPDKVRWDIEGVFLSFFLRTCPGLCELEVIGVGLPQKTFFPPALQSLRSLTLQLGPGKAHPNLAFLRQSPYLQQLSLAWRCGDSGDESETRTEEIMNSFLHSKHLKSLTLDSFPPSFFAVPPAIHLPLESLCLSRMFSAPIPASFLQLFAPTLRHLLLDGYTEPANPPPNEPLLPHLISLNRPELWRALGFAGPVGGDKKA